MGPRDQWDPCDHGTNGTNVPMGPMGSWDQWDHGTNGTMGPMGPRDQRDHGTNATMGPWGHGTNGTMGPCDHGTMGPWGHGTMGPWDQAGGSADGLQTTSTRRRAKRGGQAMQPPWRHRHNPHNVLGGVCPPYPPKKYEDRGPPGPPLKKGKENTKKGLIKYGPWTS